MIVFGARVQGGPSPGRSFHAAGQPAHAQVGVRSQCPVPWLTAGVCSFPPVLARLRHGLPMAARRGFQEGKCR